MSRSYSKRSKKPFGTYTAFTMLQNKYSETGVETLTKPFYENWMYNLGNRNSLYVVISRRMLMSDRDREALLQYVDNGNHVFISAEYIDDQLLDTLGINAQYFTVSSMFQTKMDTAGPMHFTTVSALREDTKAPKKYGFFYYPLDAHFLRPDSIGAVTLGVNEEDAPNYISLIHGKGRFFFHLNPEAFSNYFLLQNENKGYMEDVFSFMSAQRRAVYWDDYYRIGKLPNENFSSFAVFLKYPMLKWALLLGMALMILYISFASKRRQRSVPIKPVNSNASKSFVETIGRLYLQKKDNPNIVHKMTTYFLEYIRTHYYLNTAHLNQEFFSSLSRKSGVHEMEVKQFFQFIQQLQESHKVSDEELLEYNNRIQQFINKKYG
ncbi:DUF4350 domain-containing protein [Lacibacter sp. H407]|uniref:DUF4350 domain-containing protein n=1 Tax=Lacibacter sp. H407 TaxID=3133423 RepID=UPI0030C3AEDC